MLIAAQIVITLACVESSEATDLDRPLNDKPTVRTEITRGINTAFDCGTAFANNALQQQRCMITAMQQDRDKHADYEPFQLGVFYGGCLQFQAEVNAARDLAKTIPLARKQLPTFRSARKSMFEGLKAVQLQMQITDTELVEAGGDKGADAVKTLAALRVLEATHGEGN